MILTPAGLDRPLLSAEGNITLPEISEKKEKLLIKILSQNFLHIFTLFVITDCAYPFVVIYTLFK
jgi:hypothetical protein